MIEFQASPVEHRISVRKAGPKLWKFTWTFISSAPFRSINANCAIPMIENMKIRSIKSRPREDKDGIAWIRVLKIYCNFYCFLIKRKTRPILSVLNMVPKMAMLSPTPAQLRIRMMIVPTTTVKSNRFQLSRKYSFFCAMILTMASMVKMVMKK